MQPLGVDLLEKVNAFIGCLRGKVIDDHLALIVVCIQHRVSVERLAVQRCGRRQAGGTILRRCHCGDHICCNGMFDGGKQWFLLGPTLNSLQLPVLP